ncbi:uncharacterized protein LOC123450684 [Hordeum vulgare subsp. vulgare]|nr:uncharacterized protein LOC123450684 [Hordeum vulgare subsp. vulgare]
MREGRNKDPIISLHGLGGDHLISADDAEGAQYLNLRTALSGGWHAGFSLHSGGRSSSARREVEGLSATFASGVGKGRASLLSCRGEEVSKGPGADRGRLPGTSQGVHCGVDGLGEEADPLSGQSDASPSSAPVADLSPTALHAGPTTITQDAVPTSTPAALPDLHGHRSSPSGLRRRASLPDGKREAASSCRSAVARYGISLPHPRSPQPTEVPHDRVPRRGARGTWRRLAPRASPPANPARRRPSSPAPRPQQQPSPTSLAQQDALRAADEFFSGRVSSGEYGDSDDEDEGSEPEDDGDTVAGFFLGLFERDAAVRGYYEWSHEEGEFRCMGALGRKRKGSSRAKRFQNCISLVHHARDATRCGRPLAHRALDATRCGRPLAHRALAAVVCRVLGWDAKRGRGRARRGAP